MEFSLIIGYILVICFATIIPLIRIISTLIENLVGIIGLQGMRIGIMFSWVLLDLIWSKIFKYHIPVLLYLLCFLIVDLYWRSKFKQYSEEENFQRNMSIGAEQWIIVTVCVITMFISKKIHWY